MSHRNILNTRLLPLSILISSLVSSGAIAASTTADTLDKLQDYLNQGVITSEQKEKLAINFADKKAKLDTQVAAKQAQEAAKQANTKAKSNEFLLGVKSSVLDTLATKTEKAKTKAEDELTKLNKEKAAAITAVDQNWDVNTLNLAKELQDLINTSTTPALKIAEAKAAQQAIAEAEAADQLVQDATTAHTAAENAAQNTATQYNAAQQHKLDVNAELATKTTEMNNAVAALAKLDKATDPTIDMPVFEQIIGKSEQQTVAANTLAFATHVAGGVQNVEKGGQILDSIISEDGTINLAAGALANSTVINKGIINNNGGTDSSSVIGDGGKLILAGNKVADVVNIAQSHDAQVLVGGAVIVEKYAESHNLASNGGTVALNNGAKAYNTSINGGTLTLAAGANANNTSLANTSLELVEGAIADDTKVGRGAEFILKNQATTAGTHVIDDGKFTLESGSTANLSFVYDGTMTVNTGATVKNTSLADEYAELILETGAKAESTIVHPGATFTINNGATALNTELNFAALELQQGATADGTILLDGSTFTLLKGAETKNTYIGSDSNFVVNNNARANNTTVNGGEFDLLALAQADKLTVDSGEAVISGQLTGSTLLNGGTTTINKTANVSGTIDANKNSTLSVQGGATTQNVDLNLAGNMQLFFADAPLTAVRTASRAAFAGHNGKPAQFAFKNVKLAGGNIDMSQSAAQLTMASLAGDGSFNLGSTLVNHTSAPLNITGNADGAFSIQINNSGVAPANLNVIDIKGKSIARFVLANGPVDLGNYKHSLVSDGKGGFKLVANKTKVTSNTAGILAVANTMPVIFNAELSSIHNRLDKQSSATNESGVWLTYLNDSYDVKGTATNFNQKLSGMTLGGDKAIELGDAVFSVGSFASHTSSNIKSDYQSSGNVESNSLGAYVQYLANSGYYLNGVFKTNQFKQNLSVTSQANNATGAANFSGMGLAVKAGKHINIDAMYVSPYVALNTFSSGKSQYKLSNGMEAQNQGSRTTTGTLGMNTGYRFVLNSGAEIRPYAIFSVDHDLMASNKVMINNEMFDNSLKGTRANAGVGINVNLTSNLSIGSEVKISKGKNIATPMTINMAVAYTF
ncbi:autotransporter outer membrane beta-barrel domain-containing protein [Yersinia kristensenii]|uniref:autotransporter outer membrane beta-barrel domain-containing protein n=1 Tax=Yersinia kristensenii TaxID=28152 RepID=UPI003896D23A